MTATKVFCACHRSATCLTQSIRSVGYMTNHRSDVDRQAQGADGYSFEDLLADLLELPPLTEAERTELEREGVSV